MGPRSPIRIVTIVNTRTYNTILTEEFEKEKKKGFGALAQKSHACLGCFAKSHAVLETDLLLTEKTEAIIDEQINIEY
jgi:hypothetical protein